MALRIKELCREKHITMTEIASKIGIHPITLSQSLNGNPTLSRLQEVANALGVDVAELFEQPKKESMYGCIYVNGSPEPVIIRNREQLKAFLDEMSE